MGEYECDKKQLCSDGAQQQSSSLRTVAFVAVVFSTVAITACLTAFPMIFQYVQTLEATIQSEIDFCKSRSRDMWREMLENNHGEGGPGVPGGHHSEDGLDILLRATRQVGQCCTCQQGPPGAAGNPGSDGKPGTDGKAGNPGTAGADANQNDKQQPFPAQCDCVPRPGPPGPAGPKGPPGPPGPPGGNGGDGDKGADGPPGPPGPPGGNGKPGPKGPPGDDGVVQPPPALPQGPPGQPGKDGPPGGPGDAGKPGAPGADGKAGEPGPAGDAGKPGANGKDGAKGPPGPPGPKGSCDHCPPARLAPGY